MPIRHPIILPDLGLADSPVKLSLWLTPLHAQVVEGDRVVELVSGEVTVDLPAPVTGQLVEQLAGEDDILEVGQQLGTIQEE